MWLAGDEADGTAALSIDVEPDRLREIKVFVRQPRQAVQPGSTGIAFRVTDANGETARERTEFFAPEE
jgi:hypothetical protein